MTIKFSDITGGGIPFGNNASRPANPGVGKLYSNGETARLELYTSNGAWENIVQEVPGVSSISGTYLESSNSGTITIYGTNFVSGAVAYAIGANAVQVAATSTTFNSLVQLTATFTELSSAYEPYDIKVQNPSNLFGLLVDALYVNNNPTWTTPAGSLGTFAEQVNATIYALGVSDDSVITYSLASGSSLPSGVTLSSSGVISGTLPDVASNTTYTFTVNATDGSNPTISRTFSFISNAAPVWVTSAGSLGSYATNTYISTPALSATDSSDTVTYALASGSSLPPELTLNSATGVISGTLPVVSSDTIYEFTINATDGVNVISRAFSITSEIPFLAEYLVVAGGGGGGLGNGAYREGGGGGGAGGLKTGNVSLSPATAYTVTVGAKGIGKVTGSTGFGTNGGDSVFSTITSTGGGGGAPHDAGGLAGGSGGGAGCQGSSGGNATPAGQGNNGGAGYSGTHASAGGGGGYGSVGQNGLSGQSTGGAGGSGLTSTITGTSFVYAAGGGGGGHTNGGAAGGVGAGRGGGQQTATNPTPASDNTGSGGGGGTDNAKPGQDGGSGVVILKYLSTKTPTLSGNLVSTTSTAVTGYKITTFTAGTGTVTF